MPVWLNRLAGRASIPFSGVEPSIPFRDFAAPAPCSFVELAFIPRAAGVDPFREGSRGAGSPPAARGVSQFGVLFVEKREV